MTNVLKCFSEIPEEVGAEVDSTYNLMIDRYLAKPLIVFHMGNSPSGKKRVCFHHSRNWLKQYLSLQRSINTCSFLYPVICLLCISVSKSYIIIIQEYGGTLYVGLARNKIAAHHTFQFSSCMSDELKSLLVYADES